MGRSFSRIRTVASNATVDTHAEADEDGTLKRRPRTGVEQLNLLSPEVREAAERELPPSMLEAQNAIETPEVQEIIEQLAKYNLGVCMPHMHVSGDFQVQPATIVQVEAKSEFLSAEQVAELGTLPVSWRWHEGQVIVCGSCHVNQRKCDG